MKPIKKLIEEYGAQMFKDGEDVAMGQFEGSGEAENLLAAIELRIGKSADKSSTDIFREKRAKAKKDYYNN